jgi:hypothetical protein
VCSLKTLRRLQRLFAQLYTMVRVKLRELCPEPRPAPPPSADMEAGDAQLVPAGAAPSESPEWQHTRSGTRGKSKREKSQRQKQKEVPYLDRTSLPWSSLLTLTIPGP